MSRDYEMALIVDTQENADETVKRYESLLAEHGTVVNVDRWGVRRLAYEIHKRQQGDYTFFFFGLIRARLRVWTAFVVWMRLFCGI
jgi:small subunit ribosomal protein S6